MNISVVIPAYKNTRQLADNLATNLPHLKGCEVIVVNDYPPESLQTVTRKFPAVTLIENAHNLGFAGAVNVGVSQAQGDYVMLLNSDVVLLDSSFRRAVEHLHRDSNLFAVSFAQRERDGGTVGSNRLYWKDGMMYHSKSNGKTGPNGWAEGGACMVNARIYRELGGFDTLFSPFYWEDIDLSYRAWRSGYAVMYDSEILVEHHHESTIGKYFGKQQINATTFRNQLIFIWKNIDDRRLMREHRSRLPGLLLRQTIKGEFTYLSGFLRALFMIGEIRDKRSSYKLTDQSVLDHFHE